jgi:hypothetical protein
MSRGLGKVERAIWANFQQRVLPMGRGIVNVQLVCMFAYGGEIGDPRSKAQQVSAMRAFRKLMAAGGPMELWLRQEITPRLWRLIPPQPKQEQQQQEQGQQQSGQGKQPKVEPATTFSDARFGRLLGMVGSDHDGEVINAARKADKYLRSHGRTWAEVTLRPPKSSSGPLRRPW